MTHIRVNIFNISGLSPVHAYDLFTFEDGDGREVVHAYFHIIQHLWPDHHIQIVHCSP